MAKKNREKFLRINIESDDDDNFDEDDPFGYSTMNVKGPGKFTFEEDESPSPVAPKVPKMKGPAQFNFSESVVNETPSSKVAPVVSQNRDTAQFKFDEN